MNKYLEKIAAISEENKQTLKTFAQSTAASLPLSLAGAAVGGALAHKFKRPMLGKTIGGKYTNETLGAITGSHVAGGIGELAALKHGFHSHSQTLKEKQNERK